MGEAFFETGGVLMRPRRGLWNGRGVYETDELPAKRVRAFPNIIEIVDRESK